jgi:hypothetical protein
MSKKKAVADPFASLELQMQLNQLMQKTTTPSPGRPGDKWNEFVEIVTLVLPFFHL